MKKPIKILIITVCVIFVVSISGYIFRKPIFNFVAPKIFDHFIADNIEKLINSSPEEVIKGTIEKFKNDNEKNDAEKEENNASEDSEAADSSEKNPKSENDKNDALKSDKDENSEDNSSNTSGNKKRKKDPNIKSGVNSDGIYQSNTHIGVLTEKDYARIANIISAQDKAQIISILKSCVARADYPDMARRVKDGLDQADMAYIESYLRSHVGPNQKKQILDILEKYVR